MMRQGWTANDGMRSLRLMWMVSAIGVVNACSMAPSDHADGGLTVGENDRLEAAAARIDARTPSPATAEARQTEADVRARLAQHQVSDQ